jgi:hypothetical protein
MMSLAEGGERTVRRSRRRMICITSPVAFAGTLATDAPDSACSACSGFLTVSFPAPESDAKPSAAAACCGDVNVPHRNCACACACAPDPSLNPLCGTGPSGVDEAAVVLMCATESLDGDGLQ